jgi:Fe2+ or Zn2+ uptake regulation protein
MASPKATQPERTAGADPSAPSRSKERTAAPVDPTLVRALHGHGQRVTRQRAAVYTELAASRAHPTAVEVFNAVRGAVPGISLATVYNTLEVLVRCGLTTRLSLSDGCARYDGQLEPHLHARCESCGGVFDLHGSSEAEVLDSIETGDPTFSVTGIRVELTGLCVDCGR